MSRYGISRRRTFFKRSRKRRQDVSGLSHPLQLRQRVASGKSASDGSHQNGWATVLPFEYAGEVIDYNGFDKTLLEGEYEFINHGTISNGCDDWSGVDGIIAPTQSIALNADGTMSGVRAYESTKQNTAVSAKDVDGSWSVEDGTAYITFEISSVKYEGVFCKQTEEITGKEKIVFSAVGENNECIWGVKK